MNYFRAEPGKVFFPENARSADGGEIGQVPGLLPINFGVKLFPGRLFGEDGQGQASFGLKGGQNIVNVLIQAVNPAEAGGPASSISVTPI